MNRWFLAFILLAIAAIIAATTAMNQNAIWKNRIASGEVTIETPKYGAPVVYACKSLPPMEGE